jgi:hypothetical protein
MPERKPRKRVTVRHSNDTRDFRRRFLFGLFRFSLYAGVGIAAEIGFYNLVKLGRRIPGVSALFQFGWKVDPRLHLDAVWDAPLRTLFGQCSLWMALVYAGASMFFIEPIYRNTLRLPAGLRAIFYGAAILFWEAVTGWLLFWGTGFKIWFYDDAWNIVGMTSLLIAPIWCLTGLLVERVYRELMDPDLVRALESPLPPAPVDPIRV